MIARHERRAAADHHAAHHERAEYPPEEHAVLQRERNLEVLEDQRYHEHIVHRETHLDDVAREELHRSQTPAVELAVHAIDRGAQSRPVVGIAFEDEAAERHRERHGHRREGERLLHRRRVLRLVEHPEIEGQQKAHERKEPHPHQQHRR